MDIIKKAFLIPVNKKGKILIQDRENYKPPRWGYFGGSIERDETALQAVIREAKEELNLDLCKENLEYIGQFGDVISAGHKVERQVFLFRTDFKLSDFTVREGKGARYIDCDEVKDLMMDHATKVDIEIANHVREIVGRDSSVSLTTSCGAVVKRGSLYVIVEQGPDEWSLPKGKIKKGESKKQTAVREVKEETGISQIDRMNYLGSYRREQFGNKKVLKIIHIFLFETNQKDLQPQVKDILRAQWVSKDDLIKNLSHALDKQFVSAVV